MSAISAARPAQPADAPQVIKWALFLAIACGVGYACLLIVRPFLEVVAWAAVLAITCDPLHRRVVRWTGRPALSAFVTSALVVLAILVPLASMGGLAVRQVLALGETVREAMLQPDALSLRVTAALAPIAQRAGVDAGRLVAWVDAHASEWIAGAGQYTLSAAAGLGGAAVSFTFTAFATFLLLRHGPRLIGAIPDLLPFERAQSDALLLRIRDVVHASMHGIVAIAAIQGVLCGAMFWLLGIPAAALWGLVTMFASLVPLVGTAVVWVPGVVYLALAGSWPKAIVLAVWGAAVVSSVDNVLRPKLVADRVRLGGLPMFVAMLGGLQAFGPIGIIAGPVVFATGAAIVEVLRDRPAAIGPPGTAAIRDAGPPVGA